MATNKPVGFLKFIIVATLLLNLIRAYISGRFTATQSSMIPLAIVIWVAYRIARLQPWWPFGKKSPEYKQIKVPELERKPVIAASRQNAAVTQTATVVRKTLSEILPPPRPTTSPITNLNTLMTDALTQMKDAKSVSVREFSEAPKSNVGAREKRTRYKRDRKKVVRFKTTRAKRRPELDPQ